MTKLRKELEKLNVNAYATARLYDKDSNLVGTCMDCPNPVAYAFNKTNAVFAVSSICKFRKSDGEEYSKNGTTYLGVNRVKNSGWFTEDKQAKLIRKATKKVTQKELSSLLRTKLRKAGLKVKVTTCDWLSHTTNIDTKQPLSYFTPEEITKIRFVIDNTPELEWLGGPDKHDDISKISHLTVQKNFAHFRNGAKKVTTKKAAIKKAEPKTTDMLIIDIVAKLLKAGRTQDSVITTIQNTFNLNILEASKIVSNSLILGA
jgi:hypothetical protein